MRNHCPRLSDNSINQRGRLQLSLTLRGTFVGLRGLDWRNLPTGKRWYPSAGDRGEKRREIKRKVFTSGRKRVSGEPPAAAFLLHSLLHSTTEMAPEFPSHLPDPGAPLVLNRGGAGGRRRKRRSYLHGRTRLGGPCRSSVPPPAAVSSPHFPTFPPVGQSMSVTSPTPGPDRRQGSIINK